MFPTLLFAAALAGQAEARTYSCDLITPLEPLLQQHLDFKVDNTSGLPVRAQVIRVATGLPEVGPNAVSARPNYDNGYWSTYYNLDSYLIGWSAGDKYMLLVPQGVLGSNFTAQVHTLFGGGAYGWMQNEFDCWAN